MLTQTNTHTANTSQFVTAFLLLAIKLNGWRCIFTAFFRFSLIKHLKSKKKNKKKPTWSGHLSFCFENWANLNASRQTICLMRVPLGCSFQFLSGFHRCIWWCCIKSKLSFIHSISFVWYWTLWIIFTLKHISIFI